MRLNELGRFIHIPNISGRKKTVTEVEIVPREALEERRAELHAGALFLAETEGSVPGEILGELHSLNERLTPPNTH